MRKRLLLYGLAALMCAALAGGAALGSAPLGPTEQLATVHDDFGTTALAAGHVWQYDHVVAPASDVHGLLPADAWGAEVRTGTGGSLIYRVDAPDGTALTRLSLKFAAVVTNYSDASYNDNQVRVYASDTAADFGSARLTVPASATAEHREFSLDLDELAAGKSSAFVKIELVHAVGSRHNAEGKVGLAYVGTKLFTVDLTYGYDASEEAKDLLTYAVDDNFVEAELQTSAVYAHENVIGFAWEHGLLPAKQLADPAETGSGYVVYRAQAGRSGRFESLELTFSAQVSYLSEALRDRYQANNLKVYASLSAAEFGEPLLEIPATLGARTHYLSLDAVARGRRTVYLKIALNNVPGTIALSEVGVKLFGVSLRGKYREQEAQALTYETVEHDFTKCADYDTTTWAQETLEVRDVLVFQRFLGVGKENSYAGGEGYVLYQFRAPAGKRLAGLTFEGKGRVLESKTGENRVSFSLSTNGVKYQKLHEQGEAGDVRYSLDFTDAVDRKACAYLRIDMKGDYWHTTAFTSWKIEAAYAEGEPDEEEIPTEYRQLLFSSRQTDLSNAYACDNLAAKGLPGSTALQVTGDYAGSVVYQIEAGKNFCFDTMTVALSGRVALYKDYLAGVEDYDAVFLEVGETPDDFRQAVAIRTDDGSKRSFSYDLTEFADGLRTLYLRLRIVFPPAHDQDRSWVSFSELSVSGGQRLKSVFDVTYRNMEGASYESGENPATVSRDGPVIPLLSPVRKGYAFGGWYLAQDCSGEAQTVLDPAALRGDVELFAKWIPDEYEMTLDGNGGFFAGGAATAAIAVFQDGGIRPGQFPEPPVKEGADFIGWYLDAACTRRWVADSGFEVPSRVDGDSLVLYAGYGRRARVTFVYWEGVSFAVDYRVGDAVEAPLTPERQGWQFRRWTADGAPFDFAAPLTGDALVSAEWYRICVVEYRNIEDAEHQNPTSFSAADGALVLDDPVREGYVFGGWFFDEEMTQAVTALEATQDYVLYADWVIESYTLTITVGAHGSVTHADETVVTYLGLEFLVTPEFGYRTASVTVNGEIVRLDADRFRIERVREDVHVEVTFAAQTVREGREAKLDFAADPDALSEVGWSDNLQVSAGALRVVDAGETGALTLVFRAAAGERYATLRVKGRARVFSYNGSPASVRFYLRGGTGETVLVRRLESTGLGDEFTDFVFNASRYVHGEDRFELRAELVSGHADWVYLESLEVDGAYLEKTAAVSFYDGETLLETREGALGAPVTLADAPERAGLRFEGWYLDGALTQKYAGEPLTGELALYAKYVDEPPVPTEESGCGGVARGTAVLLAAVAAWLIGRRTR